MKGFIARRLLSLIPALFVVSIVVFMIIHLTPGDPATIMLGDEADRRQIEQLRSELGLDLPLAEQYAKWMWGVLQGNLGHSVFMNEPVTRSIADSLAPTLSLSALALVIAIVMGIPLGITAARHRGTIVDQLFMGVSLLGISIPAFLLGLLLTLLFAVQLGWLPVAGYRPLSAGLWEHLRFLILPAFALGTMQAALIARMTRSSMLEIMNANFIKTARAKGVKERVVIYRHVLKNAFIPIVTVIGQTLATLVAGAVVTEAIFNIPGIGQLIVNSVKRRDYAVIQGVVLFVTFSYVFINLLIDLLYGAIDPRVRLSRK